MIKLKELTILFEKANVEFLAKEKALLASNVSERTICARLMLYLNEQIKDDPSYNGYYVDVEYNRNHGNIKTIYKLIKINCDLILHSRGNKDKDNLLALEMKKSYRTKKDKDTDKERLVKLTQYNKLEVVSKSTISHVNGYILGIYYELKNSNKEIEIQYYVKGKKIEEYTIKL